MCWWAELSAAGDRLPAEIEVQWVLRTKFSFGTDTAIRGEAGGDRRVDGIWEGGGEKRSVG